MKLKTFLPVLALNFFHICMAASQSESYPMPYDQSAFSQAISFFTEDSIWVFADFYPAEMEGDIKGAPVILLLHQSASNAEEYRPIAPRLTKLGFNCLAVDARGGGHNYGRANRTNANLPHHGGGRQAYWDFKAALDYLKKNGFTGSVTVWGSSYSAGRMFQVLAEQPEGIVAALSFSPGRAFARKGRNGEPAWAEEVNIPVFMSWAPHELDDEKRARFDRVASSQKYLFEQETGVHGSSTLRPDKNPEGWEKTWNAVVDFLEKHAR